MIVYQIRPLLLQIVQRLSQFGFGGESPLCGQCLHGVQNTLLNSHQLRRSLPGFGGADMLDKNGDAA